MCFYYAFGLVVMDHFFGYWFLMINKTYIEDNTCILLNPPLKLMLIPNVFQLNGFIFDGEKSLEK